MKFNRTDAQTLTAAQFTATYGEAPVDKNDPEAASTAIFYDLPAGFSDKAKAAWMYLDGTAFIFEYKGQLVVTDESLYLTEHGNGTHEAPHGFPRDTFDSWEDMEAWLELVYQDLVDEEMIEPVPQWPEGTTRWYYGMRLRGFSIGCQPKEGFVEREDDPENHYWDAIVYDRPLSDKEVADYDLDFITGKIA